MNYISTVVPAGFSRYAIKMGGVLIGVLDLPTGQGAYATGLVARWLRGEPMPESVRWYPA